MRCPACGHGLTRVIDSRSAPLAAAIRRRRACEGCKARFTTYETVERPEIQYPADFHRQIGRLGGARLRELAVKGRAAEAKE